MNADGLALDPAERHALREALEGPIPRIPSRFLYDDHGSALFEAITRLPEYYQTRTELAILEAEADRIIGVAEPLQLAELGSGAGRKIGLLVEAMLRGAGCARLTLFDINALFVSQSAETLRQRYPGVRIGEVVGRFTTDLYRLGPGGRRMIVFFGSTLGNFHPDETVPFLRQLAARTGPDDTVLIGLDRVKDPGILEAAYNDSQGVTARFNKNILAGFGAAVGADLDPDDFEHVAFFDADNAWIEMRLRARRDLAVPLPGLDTTLTLDTGQELRTEISCKYTRDRIDGYARAAHLELAGWYTDPDDLFALALLRRPSP